MIVPSCGRKLDSTTSLFIESSELQNQRVEPSNASTSIENFPCCLILDQKEIGMKLEKNMIVNGDSMNRQKIFVGTRNMQDSFEMYFSTRGIKN